MRISDWSSDVCSSDLGGGRNVIFRHALFEALYTLGDVAHHVRKAAFAEQQQDQNPDDQPVPDAQTTHLNISLSRPYKNCARRMHARRSKNAPKLLRSSEGRRVGKECVSTFQSRWSP